MTPYRNAPPREVPTRRPLRCLIGWHRWATLATGFDGPSVVYEIKECALCPAVRGERRRVPIDGERVEPRPVSPDFIDAMEAAGARPELVDRLRAENRALQGRLRAERVLSDGLLRRYARDQIITERIDATPSGARLRVTDLVLSESTKRALTAPGGALEDDR